LTWLLDRLRPWSRTGALIGALVLVALGAQAELAEWVRYVESGGALRDAFFRTVSLPTGAIRVERTPAETRTALSLLLQRSPDEADLYALRAHEAERQLDFIAAEADWKRHAELAVDSAEGQLALADFYHRRLRPREEVAALLAVGASPAAASERFTVVTEQRSWNAFERIIETAEAQAFPTADFARYLDAWRERYPREFTVHQKLFDFHMRSGEFAAARVVLTRYRADFPVDEVFPLQAGASLIKAEQSDAAVLAYYEREFKPLWPASLVQNYFGALQQAERLRATVDEVRARLRANPDDIKAATWLHHYYQRQGNGAGAQAALHEYRQSKEARQADWTAEELFALSRLFEAGRNYNESARFAYALYSLPGASGVDRERALSALILLLLAAPDQPIEFGAGDLSLYRDIATMDDQPGFLNGILSLLFNEQGIDYRFASQERASIAYFHRARAAEVLKLYDREFPSSAQRAALHAGVIAAYSIYGDNSGVIEKGRGFLTAFPDAGERSQVSLLMAEAYAREGQTTEEFAVYDTLLAELAAKADGVPLGDNATPRPRRGIPYGRPAVPVGVRSPEYARVLDRYIARLVALKQLLPAVQLYAQEIARNPDDPGLYERFAGFLEQNGLGDRVESVYRDAIDRFEDRSWHHKLARWYLREKRSTEFDQLTRGVIEAFSGTDLESYFQEVIAQSSLDAVLYRQINLYAHQRFPHNLTFVRNLMTAYRRRETRDAAAWERLLREYWFYGDDLRSRFFEHLSRNGRLQPELDALAASIDAAGEERWQRLARENPAAARIIAEADLWRCHFEDAAPVLLALSTSLPRDAGQSDRIASVHRSLAYKNPYYTDAATAILEGSHRYEPRDRELLARIGDTFSDRELFERAAPFWERMPEVEPGKPEGYLEAATVFWDYYRFDDALRLMEEGRERLDKPELYAYEAGAVHENRRDYEAALREYLKGALAADAYSPARSRFLRLARRTAHRDLTEQMTAGLVSGSNPDPSAVALRVDLLQNQERTDDLRSLLTRLAQSTDSFELLDRVGQLAGTYRMPQVATLLLRRRIELTNDPVDRMRLKLALMHDLENRAEETDARRVIDELYGDEPRVLGVVRGAVDFQWRRKDYDRAFEILDDAADASHAALREGFAFEAARKATEARRFDDARRRLVVLLADKPFDGRYLGAMAATFGGEDDHAGLRDFYQQKLYELDGTEMPQTEKNRQLAMLRRGLIPALTELGQHSEALDQYIEIINRFPEDEGLVQEAALYADKQGRRPQLEDFYVKTTTDSPRDVRYHVVLARVRTHFEDLPGSVAAYRGALDVRPDRTDVWQSKATLEERMLHFEAALDSYRELYDLDYENPRWMEKIAEMHARRGERAEAVAAVKRALIEGRPERSENYFDAAARLEAWEYLDEAVEVAEQGIEMEGDNLYQFTRATAGARRYLGLMTRLRRYEEGFSRLEDALPAQPNGLPRRNYWSALRGAAPMVKSYYTPEEKAAFASFLEAQRRGMRRAVVESALLPLVEQAGLTETHAKWLYELMMASPGSSQSNNYQRRLMQLQRSRLRHDELGRQLEDYWRAHPPDNGRNPILVSAAQAYFVSGNEDGEFRALDTLATSANYSGEWLDRYYELLLRRQPDAMVALAASDRAANFVMARGDADLALRVIVTRGQKLPPVWTRAYTGLVGLHLGRQSSGIDDAFASALGPATIGERVGVEVDRDQQLAGDLWYYYGARYGEYLSDSEAAESYLPASVESATGRAGAYFDLAEFYRKKENLARAREEYEHALELDATLGSAHGRIAEALWEQGKQEEATARWRSAVETFRGQVERGRLEPRFWEALPRTLGSIGSRNLHAQLGESVASLFDLYIRRNGGYRAQEFLRPWLETTQDRGAEFGRMLDLADKANDPLGYLRPLTEAVWLSEAERGQALETAVGVARERLQQADGRGQYYAQQAHDEWQTRWLEHLLETNQGARAQAAVEDAPDSFRVVLRNQHGPLVVRIAAMSGDLDDLLRRYESNTVTDVPALASLRAAATELKAAGERDSADRLLDFYYTRLLAGRNLNAANFLGLAELRFEQNRSDDAFALLKRMLLVSGEPFENHMAAAKLIAKFGHHGEAVEILAERLQAVPWDAEARLLHAQSQREIPGGQPDARTDLIAIASNLEVSYQTRAEGARSLRGSDVTAVDLGSAELNSVAGRTDAVSASEAAPFLYDSLLDRAADANGSDQKLRLLKEAVAARPDIDATHFNLIRVARDAGDHQLAVQAFDPLLSGTAIENTLRPRSFEGDGQEMRRVDDWAVRQFLTRTRWTGEQRREAAFALAASLVALDRPRGAGMTYQIGLLLEGPSNPPAEQVLESIKGRLRMQVENASRRLMIHENLDQENIVRARVASVEEVSP